jgi:hypothetical protein
MWDADILLVTEKVLQKIEHQAATIAEGERGQEDLGTS